MSMPDCLHESWDCSESSVGHMHSCLDCDWKWMVGSRWHAEDQIGACMACFDRVLDVTTIKPEPGTTVHGNVTEMFNYLTKDSGKREEYDSGMVRDTNEGKARWDLLFARDVPYSAQFLTRVADLLYRGSVKYAARNWEQASTQEELDRMHESGLRHMMQYIAGETDEDHAAAVVANLLFAETTKWKMDNAPE